jgi:hypothetical protein
MLLFGWWLTSVISKITVFLMESILLKGFAYVVDFNFGVPAFQLLWNYFKV